MIKRLVKWWKAEPVKREITRNPVTTIAPVTMESVTSADLPSESVEYETREILGSLAQAVVTLARTSYELRQATGKSAMAQVTGGRK